MTVIENGELVGSADILEKIRLECSKISKSGDKYAANYSFEHLELFKHKAFDVLVDSSGELVGWCGLFNGGRYPEGVFRIMNRLYLRPEYRSSFFKPITRELYRRQVGRHRAGIRMLFLSRNELKGKYHLKRWIKYGAGEEGWKLSDGLVQVSPTHRQPGFQYIAYKKWSPVDWPLRMISEDEWTELPKG